MSSGNLVVVVYAYRLYMASLIGRLFYFRPRLSQEFPKEKGYDPHKIRIIEKRSTQTSGKVFKFRAGSVLDDQILKSRFHDLAKEKAIEHSFATKVGEDAVQLDPNSIKNRKQVRQLMKQERAKFSFATCDIFRMYLCAHCIRPIWPRVKLRKTVLGRKSLNFLKGEEKINKELDIANIVLALRRQK